MKLFLTSAGFDNPKLVKEFFTLTSKKGKELKALFIPTALRTPEMKEAVPVFLEDLYRLGILKENIEKYDMEDSFSGEIRRFDVIFFTAGDPVFLMNRINETGFVKQIDLFMKNGGIFIGVSAGSDIACRNLPDGLSYIDVVIECHSDEGSPDGKIDEKVTDKVMLSDMQALILDDSGIRITSGNE